MALCHYVDIDCKCGCRLDASVCNNKQRWNETNADVNVKN